MPLPVAKIGDWTTTQLVRFIRDILETQPPQNFPTAIVGDAKITSSLEVTGTIAFPKNPDFHDIGVAGEPAFQNGWTSWGSPYFPVGYWLDPLGFVHLRGTLKSGTVGSAAFTLPPGLRPALDAGPFIVLSNGAAGRVDVGSDGTVKPTSPSNNTYVVLDGIYYRLT
jgi:hypothetical protein